MTQQNAALVEQSTAAAQSLKDQAARLGEAVAMFRFDGSARAATPPRPAPSTGAALPRSTVSAPLPTPVPVARPDAAAQTSAGDDWESF